MNLTSLNAFSSPRVSLTIFNLDATKQATKETDSMINLTEISTEDISEIEKNDTTPKINERVRAMTA